jgi:AcrR family transcriptional regulator
MADASEARLRGAATLRKKSRSALIKAGREVFTERGWKKTRMDDVAAAAGVSLATAYNHFKTKGALVAAIYAELIEPLTKEVEDRYWDLEWPDLIDLYIRGLVDVVNRNPILTKCLFRAMMDDQLRVVAAPANGEQAKLPYVPMVEPLAEIIERVPRGAREAIRKADAEVLGVLSVFQQYGEFPAEMIDQQIEWFKSFVTRRV